LEELAEVQAIPALSRPSSNLTNPAVYPLGLDWRARSRVVRLP